MRGALFALASVAFSDTPTVETVPAGRSSHGRRLEVSLGRDRPGLSLRRRSPGTRAKRAWKVRRRQGHSGRRQ